ncbi:MAG: NAD(P)/FAD-dependent oxidoreductase, partial [Oscillochloris sp.]|nr:NAD(P)/FAD-dependent oxidoreductase [Oscillochloris sp.]
MSTANRPAAEVMGLLGLPMPVRELAAQSWDVLIVGAGHNGLTCAAYLAQAGKRVLILEARERIGGACTLEEVWPGVRISPCAYLSGLLHPKVIAELDLPRRGFDWTPALNGLFVPFEDGSSIQLYEDGERCEAEVRALAPADVAGWREMSGLMGRLREA